MQNVSNREFLGRFVTKKPKAGERFRIGNSIYDAEEEDAEYHKRVLEFRD